MASKSKKTSSLARTKTDGPTYEEILSGISSLLDAARRSAARAINTLMTATYWEVGRRIVEFEQDGRARADYGEGLISQLADDLTKRHGRGFSKSNLFQMRAFYQGWEIFQTLSGKFEARVRVSRLLPPSENPRDQAPPERVMAEPT
jgi:hypothetical protein